MDFWESFNRQYAEKSPVPAISPVKTVAPTVVKQPSSQPNIVNKNKPAPTSVAPAQPKSQGSFWDNFNAQYSAADYTKQAAAQKKGSFGAENPSLFVELRKKGVDTNTIHKKLDPPKKSLLEKADNLSSKFLDTTGTILSTPFKAIEAVEKGIGAGTQYAAQKVLKLGKDKSFKELYDQSPTIGRIVSNQIEDMTKWAHGYGDKTQAPSALDYFVPEFLGLIADAGVESAVLAPVGSAIATKTKSIRVSPEQMVDVMTGRAPKGGPLTPEAADLIRKELLKPETAKTIIKQATKEGVEFKTKGPASPARQIVGEFVGGSAEQNQTKVMVGGQDIKSPFQTVAEKTNSPLSIEAKKYSTPDEFINKTEKIGSGSDRDIYKASDMQVIKVAKNERGVRQNALAGNEFAQKAGLIPKMYSSSGRHVLVEKIDKPDTNTIKMVDELNQLDTIKLVGKVGGIEAHETELAKAKEIMNKYGYNGNALGNYEPAWEDIKHISNWGTTKEGKPILVDEGALDGKIVLDNINQRETEDESKYETKSELKRIYKEAHEEKQNESAQSNYNPQKPLPSNKESLSSKLAEDIKAKAVEKKLIEREAFADLPEHQRVDMAEQAKAAVKYVKDNPEQAFEIAMGRASPPSHLLPESIFTAVENNAFETGNSDQILQLGTKSGLINEATAMGQRFRALAEREKNSPLEAIRELSKKRKEHSKNTKVDEAKKKIVNDIKKSIKKTAPKVKDWESFINELKCT